MFVFIRNADDEITPTKKAKKNNDKASKKVGLRSLKESEQSSISEFVDMLKQNACMFDIVKIFLRDVSLNYDKVWYV
jgi:hypothetical protein